MPHYGKTMPVSADQVIDVRLTLQETQDDFARRFSRSRFAIMRWEAHGVKFKYRSQRWRVWQGAVESAIALAITRGATNEQIANLRELRILRGRK